MSSSLEAPNMQQGVDDLNGLSASCSMLPARLRWGVYLLLIAIAVGNMTGRLLSVNSVDKSQLEVAKIREALDRARKTLIKDGVTGEQLESEMAIKDQRLRDELRLQRPFLS